MFDQVATKLLNLEPIAKQVREWGLEEEAAKSAAVLLAYGSEQAEQYLVLLLEDQYMVFHDIVYGLGDDKVWHRAPFGWWQLFCSVNQVMAEAWMRLPVEARQLPLMPIPRLPDSALRICFQGLEREADRVGTFVDKRYTDDDPDDTYKCEMTWHDLRTRESRPLRVTDYCIRYSMVKKPSKKQGPSPTDILAGVQVKSSYGFDVQTLLGYLLTGSRACDKVVLVANKDVSSGGRGARNFVSLLSYLLDNYCSYRDRMYRVPEEDFSLRAVVLDQDDLICGISEAQLRLSQLRLVAISTKGKDMDKEQQDVCRVVVDNTFDLVPRDYRSIYPWAIEGARRWYETQGQASTA